MLRIIVMILTMEISYFDQWLEFAVDWLSPSVKGW